MNQDEEVLLCLMLCQYLVCEPLYCTHFVCIKYNSFYKDTDTTGLSQLVLTAAVALKEKSDNLIGKFSMTILDKVERKRLKRDEELENEVKVVCVSISLNCLNNFDLGL